MDGMEPVEGIAGRYAGELERSLQEGFPHALALFIPIRVAAVPLVKIHGRKAGFSPVELRVTHFFYADRFPFTHLLTVEDTEAVPFLEPEEIHRPGIDIGNTYNQVWRSTGRNHVVPEGGVDCNIGLFGDNLHRPFISPNGDAVTKAEYGLLHLAVLIHNVLEGRGIPVIGLVGIAGA